MHQSCGWFIGAGVGFAAAAATPAHSQTPCQGSVGPDVIVGSLHEVQNYTAQVAAGLDALSLGTTSCNVGTANVLWVEETPQHPVIGGTLYKLHTVGGAARFEQIGQSWLKHSFYALSENLCCTNCEQTKGDQLGVGCSDPYAGWRNGSQYLLGPKFQVNPHTGVFEYPPGGPGYSGEMARRLQVELAEVQPSSSTVRYFGQGQYVTADDSANGNQNNNASYREMIVTGTATDYNFELTTDEGADTTQRERPAIRAWKDVDPTINEVDVQVPNEGLFIVSYQVTDLGEGAWHYEYAVYNLNSDRAGGSFSVPVADCVNVTNIGFHDVAYRNGDGEGFVNRSGTDWASTRAAGALTWNTETFEANANANALRWGTLYNFRFDADQPPGVTTLTLGLYKPGTPASMLIAAQGPRPVACSADINDDLFVDVNDLLALIGVWGKGGGNGPADIIPPCGDGAVDVNDLLALVGQWGPCE